MEFRTILLIASCAALAACAGPVPYRSGILDEDPSCTEIYARSDARRDLDGSPAAGGAEHRCWQRSVEEHAGYDLLFAEFTDQGWVQESSNLGRPAEDYLDHFMAKLRNLHGTARAGGRGLSLFVFVHGWHHNARATDPDVISFRRFLADMAALEAVLGRETGKPKRVLGIYVGWRGESLTVPLLNELTFWERKNTAERVALGTVRELLEQLDHFRDRSRGRNGDRDVRMLTIGHSFGGLATYAAMGPAFLRYAVRFKERREGNRFDRYMSRVGDLVVIVNPAFEGARYEPLHTAGQRLCGVEPDQLPVLVLATSKADLATSVAFPLARQLGTLLERSEGYEDDAIVKAVGHSERYITHKLSLCSEADTACRSACDAAAPATQQRIGALTSSVIDSEYRFMQRFATSGFGRKEALCGGLELSATKQWHPQGNPFWVVQTTGEIMDGHGDIFNPNFVAFFRQLYLGFIYARHNVVDDGKERNPCRAPD